MSKLTVKQIQNAKSKEKEYNLSDGSGLFLRIRTSGAKSWVYFFRMPNSRQLQRMTIGSVDEFSLKEAREEVPVLKRLVSQGIDPRLQRAATKAENAKAITMQTLFDEWIKFNSDVSAGADKNNDGMSAASIKRHTNRWRLHLKESLENLLVKDISREHLSGVLLQMRRGKIKEETRKALSTLNLMLDYALLNNHISQNPARLLKPKDFLATASSPRQRVLSLDELQLLWNALEKACCPDAKIQETFSMSIVTASAIKLLIILGARRTEVAAMSWDELQLDQGIWQLPKERSKNGRPHTFYLPTIAIELLNLMYPLTGNSKFVFDTQRVPQDSHIHPDTLSGAIAKLRGIAKGAKKKLLIEAPLADLEPFTVHDIRRSASTAWGEYLKIEPHIIEKMLNHQPMNKLIATYQRAIYAEEQKNAWLAWGCLIEKQIAND